MMPLADLVPLSGSNSNHSLSRSADDCVTQLRDPVELLLAQALRVLAELEQAHADRAGDIDDGSGGTRPMHRLDRLGRARHDAAVFVGRFGIARRVAIDLAARLVVIVPRGQIVAVVHRRDRARQRQDLQAVPRQFQVADDLRAQQADHVGEFGEAIAGEDLLGDRRAADDVAALEDHHLLAGARQIGAGDQAVVAGADDDRVVVIGCHAR